ncbi:MAG: O-antigen/teichoic acid export membrane protein [Paraglaciecola sp.]|jgi:O-antigen/teichoic acid export membrane protein
MIKAFLSPRFQRLAKESSWIIVGQIAAVLGMLILVRVLTEYLDPTQFGRLALGLTVAGLVNQVVMGGITAGIGRFYSIAAEKQDLNGYLHATRGLLLYATMVVVVISLPLIIGLLWLGYTQWIALAAAALIFSVLGAYNGALNGIQNAARQRAIVALHGGLDAWLKIGLALGVMFWLGNSSTAVVIGYACSSLLITLSQLVFLRQTIPVHETQPTKHHQWMRQMWFYSMPFSAFGLFTWVQQVSDRWALQTFASTTDVGHYAVLFQLGYTPITIATGMCVSFFGPILYQRSGNATDHTRNANVHHLSWRITQLSLLTTLVGFILTFFMHEWLFRLLVATEYRGSSYYLPWVVLAGGLFAGSQVLTLKLMSEMKTSLLTIVKITTALIGVLCNVLGAIYFGMKGVVGALVVFSVIYFVWMVVIAQNSLTKNRDKH